MGKMARRMLVIPPTEPCSLWTTSKEVVVPLLAMDLASYFSGWTEETACTNSEVLPDLSLFCRNELTELCLDAQPERMKLGTKCDYGTTLMGGIIEIANKHEAENPGTRMKTKLKFSYGPIGKVDEDAHDSSTLTRTLSCASPQLNMKLLTAAIKNGFGPMMDKVEIIVDGNELEMLYDSTPIFKSQVVAAESLIKYAVRAARNRWLIDLQRTLFLESERCDKGKWKVYLQALRIHTAEKLKQTRVEWHTMTAAEYSIKSAFGTRRGRYKSIAMEPPWIQTPSTDWGKKLTKELVQCWLDWSDLKAVESVEFKYCLAEVTQCNKLLFSAFINDYVCSQLREQTSPYRVTIRMTKERDDIILTSHNGPPSDNTCIMESKGEEGGKWMSISDDAAGPGQRRVLICRTSNFTAALSDFLRTTDIGQFTSLQGYERVENGNSGTPPSRRCSLMDVSSAPSSFRGGTEADGSYLRAALLSGLQPERMDFGMRCANGTNLTDGLMEIAKLHQAENPGTRTKLIFGFTDRAIGAVDGEAHKSTTVTSTLSCASPPRNLRSLTAAIKDGFGPLLDMVKIIVDGNELVMLYDSTPIFKSQVVAAESLIKYAVRACRSRWLQMIQENHYAYSQRCNKDHATYKDRDTYRKFLQAQLAERRKQSRKEWHATTAAEDSIQRAFTIRSMPRKIVEKELLWTQEYSSDWKERLIGELVQCWLDRNTQKPDQVVEINCSGSSAETTSCGAPSFSAFIGDYVCSQLRKQISPNDVKRVTIRMTNARDNDFPNCLQSHSACIMESTSEGEGRWISILDETAGPGQRRVLICRTSNFTAALSDFLRTTDVGQFASLQGYKRVHTGNPGTPPSTITNSREVSIANYLWDWTEADASDLLADLEPAATPSCSQPERMDFGMRCAYGTNLTDGLMEIAKMHEAENPGTRTKLIFEFTDRAIGAVDEEAHKSTTVTCTLSCASPQRNLRSLTAAIKDGFGPLLDKVKIIVDGNELVMLYNSKTLFRSEIESAEYLIKYAVHAARNRWLKIHQCEVIEECGRLPRSIGFEAIADQSSKKLNELRVQGHTITAAETTISNALNLNYRLPNSIEKNLLRPSIAWGEKLTGELLKCWLEWKPRSTEEGVEIKCSSSSARDTHCGTLTYSAPIKDYVCFQLRKSTSPNDDKRVTIRVINERDDDFLSGPPYQNACCMESTSEAEGKWMSISDDAARPGQRRVLICRTSNFTAALSDFLRTTDIGQFATLQGYKRFEDRSSDTPPSTICNSRDVSIASYLWDWTEADGSHLRAGSEPAAGCTQPKRLKLKKKCDPSTNSTDASIENLNKRSKTRPSTIGK